MLTEADTCRKYVVPKLQGAGWDNDPHSIAEQRFFTDGRIVVHGSRASRRLNSSPFTRRQRAGRVKRQQAAFFNYFKPEAQKILNDLLEKHASDGELQFTLPDVLKLPPVSHHGNVTEIITKFGGAGPAPHRRQPVPNAAVFGLAAKKLKELKLCHTT